MAIDISNKKFGRLLAIKQIGWHPLNTGKRMPIWLCICDCGKKLEVRKPYLTSGDTASCGCLRKEKTALLKYSHGQSHKTSTYDIWVLMRQRCNNPKATNYKNYGGIGINVCDRWNEFKNFLNDMGERPDGLSIDRINPYGNYEPSNCRWATQMEQANNKRKRTQKLSLKEMA